MVHRREQGQVTPLIALLVVAAAAAALVVAELGATVTDRARARTAADAAALAGATGGRPDAEVMARANHGVLERFVAVGPDTEVTVRVGRARATARASTAATAAASHDRAPDQVARAPVHTLRSMLSPSGAIAQSVRAHP